ncbi:amino acid adenylation domain-containing protein [Kitasatospora sp. NPDC004272]
MRESFSELPTRGGLPKGYAGPEVHTPWLEMNAGDVFRSIAAEHPEAVAVSTESGSTTYRELAARVNSVAADLTAATGSVHGVVAVLAHRGVDLVAALLGVLAADRVYVPVDAQWPAGRIRTVVEQCGAQVLLVDGAHAGLAASLGVDARVLPIAAAGTPEAGAPPAGACGDEPAYTVFTSGTTGVPKGAVNTHRGLMNHLSAKVTALGLTAGDRVAQSAPQSFDIAVWQMLAPLLVGAECVVVSDEVVHEPAAFLAALRERRVSVLEVVPSLMYPLLEELDRTDHRGWELRWLLLGGESVKPQLCTAWLERFPEIPIMNVYGPTECADDITHHVVGNAGDLSADGAHTPIGTPLQNTTLYVLREEEDGAWVACGAGEKGELFASGAGVGLGYVRNPEATARAFFRDPADPAGRMYRTGDAAVVGEDGVFVCLGRRDRQVKIRGHRIELEEIESRILSTGPVRQCAVLLHEWEVAESLVTREVLGREPAVRTRRQELHAFLVLDPDGTVGSVRAALAEHLPPVMSPDRLIRVDALPTTPNGKADYGALAARLHGSGDSRPAWLEPRGTAAQVAELWRDVVGRYPQHLDEELAEAGLDSLHSMVLGIRLGALAGSRVSTGDVLRAVTFRGLLQAVADATRRRTETPAATAPSSLALPDPHGGPVEWPLARQQQGAWFHWQLDPENPYYTYQGYLDVRGTVDDGRLRAAWRAALARHPHLTGVVTATEDGPRLRFPAFDLGDLEIRDLRGPRGDGPGPDPDSGPGDTAGSPAARFRTFAAAAAAEPFDLESEPFVRATGFRVADDRFHLLLTTHELALDGWGAQVFARTFTEEYAAAGPARRERRPEPDGAAALGRYLSWQAAAERSGALDASRRYWADVLGERVPRLGAVRPAADGPAGHAAGLVQHHLSAETDRLLHRLAREARVTPFTVLATALWLALSSVFGEEDLVLGVPVTHRTAPEAEHVTAFLINMVPLRIDLDPDLAFGDAIRRVGSLAARGLDHSDVPLADTVAAAARRGVLGAHRTLFDVMLNMLNFPAAEADGDRDATIVFRELWTGYTKYPLAFYAQSREGTLHLELAYLADRFAPEAMERLLAGLVAILDRAAADPGEPMRRIAASAGLSALAIG